MFTSSPTQLGRAIAKWAERLASLLGFVPTRLQVLYATSSSIITGGLPMPVWQSEPFGIPSAQPPALPVESGSASTLTTPPTSSTRSPSDFDAVQWADHLKSAYGIPQAMEDGEEDDDLPATTFGPLDYYKETT